MIGYCTLIDELHDNSPSYTSCAIDWAQLPAEDIAGPFTAVGCFNGETFEPVEFYLGRDC